MLLSHGDTFRDRRTAPRTRYTVLSVPDGRTETNEHFEDTQSHRKRAGETAKRGVGEKLEPIRERVRSLTGGNGEPEPRRLESVRADLTELQGRAEDEAKEAVGRARGKLKAISEKRSATRE